MLFRENNHASSIHSSLVPTLDEANSAYEISGGSLRPGLLFGSDPLTGHETLQSERQRLMEVNLPTPEELFSFVVNGIDTPFTEALLFVIQTPFNYDHKHRTVMSYVHVWCVRV